MNVLIKTTPNDEKMTKHVTAPMSFVQFATT